jgi:hypothetical protein
VIAIALAGNDLVTEPDHDLREQLGRAGADQLDPGRRVSVGQPRSSAGVLAPAGP